MRPLRNPQLIVLTGDVEAQQAHRAGVALGQLVRSYRSDLTKFRKDLHRFVSCPYADHPARTLIRGGFLLGYLGMEEASTDIKGKDLPRFH
jgi:hypothetical protein